jgi:pre-mRNA-processing factor 17
MNHIGRYKDSDSEEELVSKKPKLDVAPTVSDLHRKPVYLTAPTTKELIVNVPVVDLYKPVQGPANPFVSTQQNKTMMSGFEEQVVMDDKQFHQLHRTFNKTGYTLDPDAPDDRTFVGDREKATKAEGRLVQQLQKVRKEREDKGDVSQEYLGPWARYKEDLVQVAPLAPEQVDYQPDVVFDASKLQVKTVQREQSIFHGVEERDYLGRSYLHVPTDVNVDLYGRGGDVENFIPKQWIHTWTGHTKAVNNIKWFPGSAHLILSCSTDTKVKLWDVYHDRACKRTFMGHSKGVKDISFNYDGTQFVSMGYDKYLKVWDTETGDIMNRFTTKYMPYCVQFNPTERKGHMFLVGCQDKKIYQFDTRSNEMVLEYAQHSGPINSLTFIDENQR